MIITIYRSWREIVLLVILVALAALLFAPLVYFISGGGGRSMDFIDIPKSIFRFSF